MPGLVSSPVSGNLSDGISQTNNLFGKQGEQINSDLHGKYYQAAVRGKLFKFNKTAVTVPVVAATLVSVFSLHNPPSSGVMAEIVTTEIGQVLATTVVDTLGWYFSTAVLSAAGTFTTPAVAGTNYFSARVGETPSGGVVPYSAYTHSGTPVRVDIVCSFGATTDAVVTGGIAKAHDGGLILPPGYVMSLAMSTAAGTASGLDLGVTWAEYPTSAAG